MNRVCVGWRFGCFLFAALLASIGGSASPLLVGVARRDVTPRYPVPMWGYGARHDFVSLGTRDPLYATALVLEAGTNRMAVVGLDLGRSPSESSLQRIRARLRAEASIAYSFIAGSHTHHGPVLELSEGAGRGKGRFESSLKYYKELEDQIVAAVLEAAGRLRSVKVGAGSVALEGMNRNRHTKQQPKPVDRDLCALRFDDLEGRVVAVLLNFSAHPTMLPASELKFSADYVGVLRTNLEMHLGGAPVVFMQGAAGDLSTSDSSGEGYMGYGKALAEQARRLLLSIETRSVDPASIQVREERLRFASRVDLQNPLMRAAYAVAFFPELVMNYADEYQNGVQPRLTVALLNREIALVGVSGEFFCNHALRLKERCRLKPLLFFGYCNGYHQYFPTIEAVAEGGYGADKTVAPAEVGAGERIMDSALIWIYDMLGASR